MLRPEALLDTQRPAKAPLIFRSLKSEHEINPVKCATTLSHITIKPDRFRVHFCSRRVRRETVARPGSARGPWLSRERPPKVNTKSIRGYRAAAFSQESISGHCFLCSLFAAWVESMTSRGACRCTQRPAMIRRHQTRSARRTYSVRSLSLFLKRQLRLPRSL